MKQKGRVGAIKKQLRVLRACLPTSVFSNLEQLVELPVSKKDYEVCSKYFVVQITVGIGKIKVSHGRCQLSGRKGCVVDKARQRAEVLYKAWHYLT